MNQRPFNLPKNVRDLLKPGAKAELKRAGEMLEALQRLQLVIRSGGKVSVASIQVAEKTALLTGIAALSGGESGSGVPVITTEPVGGIFGSPHTVFVVATGSSPLTYQWQDSDGMGGWNDIIDGGTYSGAQAASLTITGPILVDLRCVVTNSLGTATSTTANLIVA